jgi:hypothetical protein
MGGRIADGWIRDQKIAALSLILLCETLIMPPDGILLLVSLI